MAHELGINELTELAASVGLAGGQGAKIRRSLAAKADALRAQQAAAIETNAETRTEKMIVPVTVMIIGLTLFVGFGAVQAISTDGTSDQHPCVRHSHELAERSTDPARPARRHPTLIHSEQPRQGDSHGHHQDPPTTSSASPWSTT